MAQVVHLKCDSCSRADIGAVAAVGGCDCIGCGRQVRPDGCTRRACWRHTGRGNVAAGSDQQGSCGKQVSLWQAGRQPPRQSRGAGTAIQITVLM